MILVDSPKNGWCHLVANSITELHAFAWCLGIKKCWFNNKRGKNQPHYDVKAKLLPKLIDEGAIKVSNKTLFNFLKQTYE